MTALTFAPTLLAQGGGTAVYEVGTPNIGEAYAGFGAVASDASTAFLNPAGMTRLRGFHALAGAQADLFSARFQPDGGTTALGGGGKNAGSTFFVPAAYVVQSVGDRLRVGFSFNAPFGLGLDYSDHWAGRYSVQSIKLAVMEARPSAAVRVTNWLSIGGGLSVERASLSQVSAVANILNPRLGDGQIDVKLRDWGTGYSVGALLEPGARTRVGLTYRSQVDFSLAGAVFPVNIDPQLLQVLGPSLPSRIPLSMPRGANISIYRDVSRHLAVLADAGWAQWRGFGRMEQTLSDGETLVTDRKWRDTFRAAWGLRWRASPKTQLQAGIAHETSPVSYWDRTPDLPVDRQWRYAAGVIRDLRPSVALAASVTYADLGPGRLEHPVAMTGTRLAGRYSRARIPFVSVGVILRPTRE